MAKAADRSGEAHAKEMGSRYIIIILYVWLRSISAEATIENRVH
jgi:hypothetical protein